MKSKSVLLIVGIGLIATLINLNGSGNCAENNYATCEDELDSCIVAHDKNVDDFNECKKQQMKIVQVNEMLLTELQSEQEKFNAENATKFYKGITWGSIITSILWGVGCVLIFIL